MIGAYDFCQCGHEARKHHSVRDPDPGVAPDGKCGEGKMNVQGEPGQQWVPCECLHFVPNEITMPAPKERKPGGLR